MWHEERRIAEWFLFFFFNFSLLTYRKIPGINTYTAEQPEKEQEVIPTVTSIDVPNPGGEKSTSLERADAQADAKSRGINAPAPASVTEEGAITLIGQKRPIVVLFVKSTFKWEEAA